MIPTAAHANAYMAHAVKCIAAIKAIGGEPKTVGELVDLFHRLYSQLLSPNTDDMQLLGDCHRMIPKIPEPKK